MSCAVSPCLNADGWRDNINVNIVSRNVRRFHFPRPRMSSAPAVEGEDVDLLFVMGRPFSSPADNGVLVAEIDLGATRP